MRTYKSVKKKVVDKIYCDLCGSCCTYDNCGDEYATLEALWGYCSTKDESKYEIHLCENCFDTTIEWMKKTRQSYFGCFNYPYDIDPLKDPRYAPYKSSPQLNTYESETTNTQEPS